MLGVKIYQYIRFTYGDNTQDTFTHLAAFTADLDGPTAEATKQTTRIGNLEIVNKIKLFSEDKY